MLKINFLAIKLIRKIRNILFFFFNTINGLYLSYITNTCQTNLVWTTFQNYFSAKVSFVQLWLSPTKHNTNSSPKFKILVCMLNLFRIHSASNILPLPKISSNISNPSSIPPHPSILHCVYMVQFLVFHSSPLNINTVTHMNNSYRLCIP